MTRTIVIIRAYNADGYHRDIAVLSDRQVHTTNTRVDEPQLESAVDGWSVGIDPTKFPEMVRFDVIVKRLE